MIIGAIDGPMEVQRRDELAEEAFIDVTVRPATGIGGNHHQPFDISIHPHGRDKHTTPRGRLYVDD